MIKPQNCNMIHKTDGLEYIYKRKVVFFFHVYQIS